VVPDPIAWRFGSPADQFLHVSLGDRVDERVPVVDPEHGELALVRGRLRWAETVHRRTVLTHAAAWDEARRAIAAADGASASRLYAARPIDLPPQVGLVPIGRNPATGLWEFYHPRSAADPDRIPRHDERGDIEITGDTGIVFVLIPGGAFLRGAQPDDPDASNYDPGALPHEAPIGMAIEPFFLGRYELTQGQWLRLSSGKTPSSQGVGWDRPDDAVPPVTLAHPVEHVTWGGSQELLGRHGLELPAEASWEYACRAGETTPWFTGRDPASLEGYANVLDRTAGNAVAQWGRPEAFDDGYVAHAPVGMFRPNAFGLHDCHGNVWECCRGRDDSGRHLVRGGSFMAEAREARSAARMACQENSRHSSIGLRAARRVMD
jgi:formylglycine-generating enzyme required for sulfatase activity